MSGALVTIGTRGSPLARAQAEQAARALHDLRPDLEVREAFVDVQEPLVAQVVADQGPVIKAFEELGFTRQCTLPDYFMVPDGSTRDIVLMLMPLIQHRGEF